MDIKKLKYFLAIAQTGSYSKAAVKLFVSQATLSKHIISLEKELGVTLFDRSFRNISLTGEGQALLKHAAKITKDYDQMLESLGALCGKKLIIATMPIMVQYGITKLLADFCTKHPSVNVSIIELSNSNIVFDLEHRSYDLAFIRRDNLDLSKMEVLDIFKDQMVLIMSKQHPLAQAKPTSLGQFKADRFFFLSNETSLYDFSYSACVRAGFEPNVVFTGSRADNIAEFVAANLGVALLMQQVVNSLDKDNIVVMPISEMPSSHISLVRRNRKTHSDDAKLLWNYVRDRHREVEHP